MSPPAKGSFWQSLLITWSDSLCTNRKHVHLLHCFWSVHLQAMQCFGSAWSLYPVYCYIHLTSYLLPQVSKVKCLHLLKAPPLMTWLHSFWQSPLITWSDSLCTNHKHCSIVFGLFISNQKMYVLLFWEQLLAVGGVMALYSEYAKWVVHKFSPGKSNLSDAPTYLWDAQRSYNVSW